VTELCGDTVSVSWSGAVRDREPAALLDRGDWIELEAPFECCSSVEEESGGDASFTDVEECLGVAEL
jgi:hypothetical protein